MSVIEIHQITKDYGDHKGVFDVSFTVEKGEVVGFLGPNGAGKTTTIRQLMGFISPDKGSVSISGLDCFKDADKVQAQLGYLPGEIAFMEDMTGIEFIHFMADMKHMKDFTKVQELIDYLELDPKGKIRRMSKGMKQKIGIVIAFMQDPSILILDEPTSGLDPLMQNKFVELIKKEKARGKTILMSSHIFEEVEHTCDRVVIIKDGCIIATKDMEELRHNKRRIYEIRFENEQDAMKFVNEHDDCTRDGKEVNITLKGHVDAFIKDLSRYTIRDLQMRTQNLEELFMQYYGGENQ